jgi:hypothetical protein
MAASASAASALLRRAIVASIALVVVGAGFLVEGARYHLGDLAGVEIEEHRVGPVADPLIIVRRRREAERGVVGDVVVADPVLAREISADAVAHVTITVRPVIIAHAKCRVFAAIVVIVMPEGVPPRRVLSDVGTKIVRETRRAGPARVANTPAGVAEGTVAKRAGVAAVAAVLIAAERAISVRAAVAEILVSPDSGARAAECLARRLDLFGRRIVRRAAAGVVLVRKGGRDRKTCGKKEGERPNGGAATRQISHPHLQNRRSPIMTT